MAARVVDRFEIIHVNDIKRVQVRVGVCGFEESGQPCFKRPAVPEAGQRIVFRLIQQVDFLTFACVDVRKVSEAGNGIGLRVLNHVDGHLPPSQGAVAQHGAVFQGNAAHPVVVAFAQVAAVERADVFGAVIEKHGFAGKLR